MVPVCWHDLMSIIHGALSLSLNKSAAQFRPRLRREVNFALAVAGILLALLIVADSAQNWLADARRVCSD